MVRQWLKSSPSLLASLCSLLITRSNSEGMDWHFHFWQTWHRRLSIIKPHIWSLCPRLSATCGQSTSLPTGSWMRLQCINSLLSLFTWCFTRWVKYAPDIAVHHSVFWARCSARQPETSCPLVLRFRGFWLCVPAPILTQTWAVWKAEVIKLWVPGRRTQREMILDL